MGNENLVEIKEFFKPTVLKVVIFAIFIIAIFLWGVCSGYHWWLNGYYDFISITCLAISLPVVYTLMYPFNVLYATMNLTYNTAPMHIRVLMSVLFLIYLYVICPAIVFAANLIKGRIKSV